VLRPRPLPVPEILSGVREEWRVRVEQRGAAIEIGETTTISLSADQHLLRRVLSNLIGNALRHGGKGVRIVLGARTAPDGAGVHFTVADDGVGIPPAYHDLIFRKFGSVQREWARDLRARPHLLQARRGGARRPHLGGEPGCRWEHLPLRDPGGARDGERRRRARLSRSALADPPLMTTQTGLFLAFEGVEGSGKSTQVELLAEPPAAAGREVVVAREPGSTPLGERIRSLVLDQHELGIPGRSELFLMLAARAAFVDRWSPRARRGAVVIADRFELSTLAYQGAGRGLPVEEIVRCNRFATSGLAPDATILLELEPGRGGAQAGGSRQTARPAGARGPRLPPTRRPAGTSSWRIRYPVVQRWTPVARSRRCRAGFWRHSPPATPKLSRTAGLSGDNPPLRRGRSFSSPQQSRGGRMKLKRTLLGPLVVALVAFVSGGWLLQRGVAGESSAFQQARILEEVLNRISRDYVDQRPTEELYRMAVDGLLRELGDPHTSFMTAEEYNNLRIQTTGEYGGLGIQIAERDGWITVIAPLPGTPAERAGLLAGDRIVEVEGRSTEGWSDQDAVNVLRGPRGTAVNITIARTGVDQPIRSPSRARRST
jgi:dTMP kinase